MCKVHRIEAVIPGSEAEIFVLARQPGLCLPSGAVVVCQPHEWLQTYGDKLHVFVDDVAQRKPQIDAALTAGGISHDDIREIEVRMEEAFISLVNRQAHATTSQEAA